MSVSRKVNGKRYCSPRSRTAAGERVPPCVVPSRGEADPRRDAGSPECGCKLGIDFWPFDHSRSSPWSPALSHFGTNLFEPDEGPRGEPETVRKIKATAERDITVGGAELTAQAIKAGLVDELHLLVTPVAVGGGKPAIPSDFRLNLELLDLRRFESGVVHLRYRTRT
jgi:hypothetical protein